MHRTVRPLPTVVALALSIASLAASPAVAAPGRPAGLQALPASETAIHLFWEDTADNETGFRIQARLGGGEFQTLGSVPANTQSAAVTGLNPGVKYDFRVASLASGTASGYSNVASAYTDEQVPPTGICAPGPGVCLDNRFYVTAEWRTDSAIGDAGNQKLTNLSSAFYFFQPDNLEVLLKVLNGCAINSSFWVFFSATTNVEFTVTVIDTQEGVERRYFNPIDHPATPVQDTSAFATCP